MSQRSKAKWLALFAEQESSGLNYTEFCKPKGINPKYFSLKRIQLKSVASKDKKKHNNFIAAQITPALGVIQIEHKQTIVKLPSTISANWLAEFVQQLGN